MISPSKPTLFTLGYQQRSIRDFVRFLLEANVSVLVDVRETAWSHKPGFSKRKLAHVVESNKIRYVHARFAGNPKVLRVRAKTHEECLALYEGYLDDNPNIVEALDELIGRLLDNGERVCLMCYERHPDDCHRGVLATRWSAQLWRDVEHLGADETYRLISA